MSADLVNGLFEFGGAMTLWMNVARLWRDRSIKGVHWASTVFFAAWGLWNLFYYPHLDQWFSFVGGAALVAVNLVWVALLAYFRVMERIDAA